jgi:hypothetical protein
MQPQKKHDLAAIYSSLVKDSKITRQKYDEFSKLWKESLEFELIVSHCLYYAAYAPSLGRKFDPQITRPTASLKATNEVRAASLANSFGELLWMLITKRKLLPFLKNVSTMPAPIPELLTVEISVPTFCLFFNKIKIDNKQNIEIDKNSFDLCGWIEELYFVSYDLESTFAAQSDTLFDVTSYENASKKIKLPSYLNEITYYTEHNSEIVSGFSVAEKNWFIESINGIKLSSKDWERDIQAVGLSGGLTSKVKENASAFRPKLLKVSNKLSHDNLATFAIAATYNLGVVDMSDTETQHHVASAFTTLLIEPKLSSTCNRSLDLNKICESLWDNVDQLKLPISRMLIAESIDRERQLRNTAQASAFQLANARPALEALLRQSSQIQALMGRVNQAINPGVSPWLNSAQRLEKLFLTDTNVNVSGIEIPVIEHNNPPGNNGSRIPWMQALFLSLHGAENIDQTGIVGCKHPLLPPRVAKLLAPLPSNYDAIESIEVLAPVVGAAAKTFLHTPFKNHADSTQEIVFRHLWLATSLGKCSARRFKTDLVCTDLNLKANTQILYKGKTPIRSISSFLFFLDALSLVKASGEDLYLVKNVHATVEKKHCMYSLCIKLDTVAFTALDGTNFGIQNIMLQALRQTIGTTLQNFMPTGDLSRAFALLGSSFSDDWRELNQINENQLKAYLSSDDILINPQFATAGFSLKHPNYNFNIHGGKFIFGCTEGDALMITCKDGIFGNTVATFAIGSTSISDISICFQKVQAT